MDEVHGRRRPHVLHCELAEEKWLQPMPAYMTEEQMRRLHNLIRARSTEAERICFVWEKILLQSLINAGVSQENIEQVKTEIWVYSTASLSSGGFRILIERRGGAVVPQGSSGASSNDTGTDDEVNEGTETEPPAKRLRGTAPELDDETNDTRPIARCDPISDSVIFAGHVEAVLLSCWEDPRRVIGHCKSLE